MTARNRLVYYGALVKWLRHDPFTVVTRVRLPYASPEHELKIEHYSCEYRRGKQTKIKDAEFIQCPKSSLGITVGPASMAEGSL